MTVALIPLWLGRYLPGCDFGNHAGIADLVARQVMGEPSPYFALNLQPVPYWLGYALLAPLVHGFGPFVGLKLALTLLAIGTFISTTLLMRALDTPRWTALIAIPVFYGGNFYFGFFPTLAGLPPLLFGAWGLVRHLQSERRCFAVVATLGGLLTTTAHLFLLPPWGAFLLASLVAGGRKRLGSGLEIGLLSLLPLLPMILFRLEDGSPHLDYSSPRRFLADLWAQLGIFDRSWGELSLLAFLLLALAMGARALVRTPGSRERRFALTAFVAMIVCYCAIPMQLRTEGGGYAWGINLRFLNLILLAGVGVLSGARDERRWEPLFPTIAMAVHLGAIAAFGLRFDARMRPFDRVLEAMAPGRYLCIVSKQEPFEKAWARVATTVPNYYVALGGAGSDSIFSEAQTPIRRLGEGDCDYTILQQLDATDPRPAPENSVLRVEAGAWRLFESR